LIEVSQNAPKYERLLNRLLDLNYKIMMHEYFGVAAEDSILPYLESSPLKLNSDADDKSN